MIHVHELRLGNWFINQYGEQDQVESIQEGGPNDWYDEQCEPIHITEDILLKCGFEVLESSSCKEFHIGINEVTKDWLFSLVWLIKPELINAPNTPFYRNGGHHIAYVHQLQNLYFALTGHELTYTP